MRRAVYIGSDGGRPSLTMDANLHQIPPHGVSTIHRHSWNAMLFVTEGSGWTEIDGHRIDWNRWDSIHIPSWSWHRHGTDSDNLAQLLSVSSQPIVEALGLAVVQDRGDEDVANLEARPTSAGSPSGENPDSHRLRRLLSRDAETRTAALHRPYEGLEFKKTVKGTESAFLIDQAIGFRTSGLSQVMKIFPPATAQSNHAHPGEAFLYIVEGRGHTYVGESPAGGVDHEWVSGDLVRVNNYCWHQHWNDDPDRPARMLRLHMFDSLQSIMYALASPLVLEHEPSRPPKLSGGTAREPAARRR